MLALYDDEMDYACNCVNGGPCPMRWSPINTQTDIQVQSLINNDAEGWYPKVSTNRYNQLVVTTPITKSIESFQLLFKHQSDIVSCHVKKEPSGKYVWYTPIMNDNYALNNDCHSCIRRVAILDNEIVFTMEFWKLERYFQHDRNLFYINRSFPKVKHFVH